MMSFFRPVSVALLLVAAAAPANAQTWIYEPDTRARFYEPDVRSPYYDRYYDWDARARVYQPETRTVVTTEPLALTPAQRTIIYRTIIPQGRGRGPIVREKIVTETMSPAPVVREQAVRAPVTVDYVVGSRVTDAYALAPMPRTVINTVPAVRSYRYMVIGSRLLLVDPATGIVVADVTE
jgi:hypothetical protein